MILESKNIFITGASSGIGLELAKELFIRKSRLVLIARRKENLDKAAYTLKKLNSQLFPPVVIPCDVTDIKSVNETIKAGINFTGGIDILINNAGIGVYGTIEKTSTEDFHSVMETNFFGTVNFTLNALSYMLNNGGGLIVNIASVAALHGIPYLSTYCASKAAVVAFSQSIRAELKDKNIDVMVYYPDYTDTNFFRNEKNVGGARRPTINYEPADKVARTIIKYIELVKSERILSNEGKALKILNKFLAKKLIEYSMDEINSKLKIN